MSDGYKNSIVVFERLKNTGVVTSKESGFFPFLNNNEDYNFEHA